MSDAKPSTKTQDENTVEATHEYFFPETGVVVRAQSPEAAEKLAAKQVESGSKQD